MAAHTQKLAAALRRWHQGDTLHHQTLAALSKRGYLQAGQLTEAGRHVLAIRHLVEQQSGKNWVEIANFADQSAAEAYATRLSVLNYAVYQVRSADQPTGTLFEFGKRFQIVNGVKIRTADFAVVNEAETAELFWCIEKRTSALYNEGRHAAWERLDRRWSDFEDADNAAHEFARAAPEFDFRVLSEAAVPPPLEVYHGDQLRRDVGWFEQLVSAEMPWQPFDAVFELRARSAAALITQWAVQPALIVRVAHYLLQN